MGGLRYHYPWVFLSLDLTDEHGNPISIKSERKFRILDSMSDVELANGRIKAGSRLNCCVPNSQSVNVVIEGLELKILEETHRSADFGNAD